MALTAAEKQIRLEDIEEDTLAGERKATTRPFIRPSKENSQPLQYVPTPPGPPTPPQMQFGFSPVKGPESYNKPSAQQLQQSTPLFHPYQTALYRSQQFSIPQQVAKQQFSVVPQQYYVPQALGKKKKTSKFVVEIKNFDFVRSASSSSPTIDDLPAARVSSTFAWSTTSASTTILHLSTIPAALVRTAVQGSTVRGIQSEVSTVAATLHY